MDEEAKNIELAIKLSLQDIGNTAKSTPVEQPRRKIVKVLFDFEAVEPNELTIRTDQIIYVTDDSNDYWYQGTNEFGESGVFPSNFVSTFNPVSAASVVKIDPTFLDHMLLLIRQSDPTIPTNSPEVKDCENKCNVMAGMIEKEIDAIDTELAEMSDLAEAFITASRNYDGMGRF